MPCSKIFGFSYLAFDDDHELVGFDTVYVRCDVYKTGWQDNILGIETGGGKILLGQSRNKKWQTVAAHVALFQ